MIYAIEMAQAVVGTGSCYCAIAEADMLVVLSGDDSFKSRPCGSCIYMYRGLFNMMEHYYECRTVSGPTR